MTVPIIERQADFQYTKNSPADESPGVFISGHEPGDYFEIAVVVSLARSY